MAELAIQLLDADDEGIRKMMATLAPEEVQEVVNAIHDPEIIAYVGDRHWRSDPVGWARKRLKAQTYSRQDQILESVRDHRYTAVPASFGSGKSWTAGGVLVPWWLSTHPPGAAMVISCYTDDTEVLTRDGWKRFDAVVVGPAGDEFATRDRETHEFVWQHATRYYEEDWDGEVVDFKSTRLHLRVTPNHRMLLAWEDQRRSGEILKPAGDVGTRWVRIPSVSKWGGRSPATVRFGRYEWATRDFAAFLGAWLAEGSLGIPAKRRATNRPRKRRVDGLGGPIILTQPIAGKGYQAFRSLLTRMLGREPGFTQGRQFHFACADLWRWLRPLGKAPDKFIPDSVKDWGADELAILLQYYLLGDGHYAPPGPRSSGAWKAWTVSQRLADDLQEVAQKIGIHASITKRLPRGGGVIDGRQVVGRHPIYQMCFNTSTTRRAVASRSHYQGKVYCVSVPNEVLYVRRGAAPVWCGNTAPTGDQVRMILWKEINIAHEKGKLIGRVNLTQWYIGNQIVGVGRKPSNTNPAAFQGFHARYLLVIIDEADAVGSMLWEAVDHLVVNTDSRVLAIGNPLTSSGPFFRACQAGSRWNVIRISAFDTPEFTGEPVPAGWAGVSKVWVDERVEEYGPGYASDPRWMSKVLAIAPEDKAGSLIRLSMVRSKALPFEDAEERERWWKRAMAETPVVVGIDVGASEGGDQTVARERRGNTLGRVRRWLVRDHVELSEQIIPFLVETGATRCVVDTVGIGHGLADMLHAAHRKGRHKARVFRFNAGKAGKKRTKDHPGFPKLRDQIWWEVGRLKLDKGYVDLRILSEEGNAGERVMVELAESEWGVDTAGRIKVESKDDIKERLGHSPDDADAVLLSLYESPLFTVVGVPRG